MRAPSPELFGSTVGWAVFDSYLEAVLPRESPARGHLKVALLPMVSHGAAVEANAPRARTSVGVPARERADIALFPGMWSINLGKMSQLGDQAAVSALRRAFWCFVLSSCPGKG